MVPIHTVFVIIMVIFGLTGSLRGWAREIVVGFSVFLALFVERILITKVGPIAHLWGDIVPMSQFGIRLVVFGVIVMFGYASPTLAQRMGAKVAREQLQDILLGFFIGLLNGLLIIGTVWFYLDEAHYLVEPDKILSSEGDPVYNASWERIEDREFDHYAADAEGLGGIRPPGKNTTARNLLPYLPPRMVTETSLYIAVGMAFIFVLIVFI